MNVKELIRRQAQIEKRNGNKIEVQEDEPNISDEDEPKSKYDNGKPKKVVREQEYYREEIEP